MSSLVAVPARKRASTRSCFRTLKLFPCILSRDMNQWVCTWGKGGALVTKIPVTGWRGAAVPKGDSQWRHVSQWHGQAWTNKSSTSRTHQTINHVIKNHAFVCSYHWWRHIWHVLFCLPACMGSLHAIAFPQHLALLYSFSPQKLMKNRSGYWQSVLGCYEQTREFRDVFREDDKFRSARMAFSFSESDFHEN